MENSFILLAFAFLIHFCTSNAEFSTQDCRELGYIKSQLMCTSCDKLDEFGLENLKPHCLECCQGEKPAVIKKYPRAVLEVCTCKFRAYPQIQAFLQSERPQKFPNLEIKYVRGLDPIVKLMDNDQNVKETLSIAKWNTDTVEEFFETHLEKKKAKNDPKYRAYNMIDED